MIKQLNDVKEWQQIFGRNGHIVADDPIVIDQDLAKYRVGFIAEECDEYLGANDNNDLMEVIDALCDLQYFLYGMVVIHGMQDIFEEAFDIVHQSNMSKLEDGIVIIRESDGKVLKGKHYWGPKAKLQELIDNRTKNE